MLLDAAVVHLDRLLEEARRRDNVQLGIVTIPALRGESVEAAASRIVKDWALAAPEHDNSVLLLLSRTDRKIRIEVGSEVEHALNSEVRQKIIDEILVPQLKEGNASQAVVDAVDEILRVADPDPVADQEASERRQAMLLFALLGIALLYAGWQIHEQGKSGWILLPIAVMAGCYLQSRNTGSGALTLSGLTLLLAHLQNSFRKFLGKSDQVWSHSLAGASNSSNNDSGYSSGSFGDAGGSDSGSSGGGGSEGSSGSW